MLRTEGLMSDRLGDAMNFFELTEGQAHYAFCSCLSGRTMELGSFAQRLRNAVAETDKHAVLGAWALAGVAVAIPGYPLPRRLRDSRPTSETTSRHLRAKSFP